MTAAAGSPLNIPIFRSLWVATIVSNVGTSMQDVGSGWLMTSLSSDSLMVALVQAATTLPMFVLSLPAGALADLVDRRRLLIATQLWTIAAAATLSITTFAGLVGPVLLLVLIFAIASGLSLGAPAFQATVPELVPTSLLPQAVSLNSLGINIARAVGPAIGGLVIGAASPAAVFGLNAASTIGVIVVLFRWKRERREISLPEEHFVEAVRTGIEYSLQSIEVLTVLIRGVGFFFFASGFLALLPVVGRRELALSPTGYGWLLTLMGLGAVTGALVVPWICDRISSNRLTILASLLFTVATVLLGEATSFASAAPIVVGAGSAWIVIMSSLAGAAQMAAPAWVRARVLAIYILSSQGAMMSGSILWGWIASHASIESALLAAGVGLAASQLLALIFPLDLTAKLDLSPDPHWPAPLVAGQVEDDRGPVLITIEYQIDPARLAEFARAMSPMRRIRRRDGASSWGLFEDAAQPGLVVETFVVRSWVEHLRQHQRVTHADRENEDAANRFHVGSAPPLVRHWIAPA